MLEHYGGPIGGSYGNLGSHAVSMTHNRLSFDARDNDVQIIREYLLQLQVANRSQGAISEATREAIEHLQTRKCAMYSSG